jgi:hypothetical protein
MTAPHQPIETVVQITQIAQKIELGEIFSNELREALEIEWY